jgi:RNA polymerase sigma-70 factor (ECF subfamily)
VSTAFDPGGPSDDARDAVARAFRDEWGTVVATLIGVTGDWDLAEECTQDAFASALERWPVDGVPRRPGAWITTTARNRAVDRIRRAAVGARKHEDAAVLTASAAADPSTTFPPDSEPSAVGDDRLRLIFTCCHPALPLGSRVALTLRTLAGLTTAEIARAFLVPESTMAQRLVRAKHKIRNAAIPYRVPPAHLLTERTTAVLGVIYLVFNEGYSATGGDELTRPALSTEAIRLARMLLQVLPDDAEVEGLLALLLLHDARRESRTDVDGALVPLDEQDRTSWDRNRIIEGCRLLHAIGEGDDGARRGPYRLQAEIVACHAVAPSPATTDWARIVSLYDELLDRLASPVVELNRAVAVGMADGPAAGLTIVDELDASGRLDGYHHVAATRADLLRRLGRRSEAAIAYRAATADARTEPERRYLTRRLSEVESG